MHRNLQPNPSLRNIAIIAHVDHGKTTLVDHMFRQSGVFNEHQELSDRVMDSMDLERERGITIAAKNCSVRFKDIKINILDTPGHADFGGEVERALAMVDGAILLVDSSEGPLPQTRFVLKKALEGGKAMIVVVNKIDRPDARPQEVLNEIYDLFIDLDANDDQISFPVLYAIGRDGIAKHEIDEESNSLAPLMETIVEHVPPPHYDPNEPFQLLVADLDYNDYLGRLAVGKVANGSVKGNDNLVCINDEGKPLPLRVSKLQAYEGVAVKEVAQVEPGDIAILAGIEDVHIGDTICNADAPKALPRITVDEPTIAMRFGLNTSPLAGLEGEIVQAKKIYDRLILETLRNVALQVEQTDDDTSFTVKGRGEFQMAILIETMRREGFELSVGRPEVINKKIDGKICEPIEHLFIDCGEEFVGVVTEKLQRRKGRMTNMVNHGTGRVRMEFSVPSRSLIGYRSEFLTDTKGTGLMNSYLDSYEPYRGDFPTRYTGSLVSDRAGKAITYSLLNLEPRGELFSQPGSAVYEGMIIGEHNRENDLNVNPTKEKQKTAIRSSTKETSEYLRPIKPMTLERAIDFIKEDEMIEVTPLSIRLRKVELSATKRHTMRARSKSVE
ncbi:MAG: translational GTPase TypA [Ignavibacteriae bacterium]|nr:translational GTPase TypA [Ignavibacteriota bacterium]MCB9214805.1 translational GTPase TypA [Ignavibacteria bacterium]